MLADVMRAHGVRGEVRLRPFRTDSDLLLDVAEVLVRFPAEPSRRARPAAPPPQSEALRRVEFARRANDAILMKLEGVDDRDEADGLRGAVVCVRRGDFPDLEDGEFYACDVEGARVIVEGGDELGTVRELQSLPSVELLVVDPKDGGPAFEVPLVDAFVAGVDVEEGVVTLRTTEGLERSPQ
jgi:16S rRNA processing protein RimM